MRRREQISVKGEKVVFRAIEGRRGGRGIFGLEEKAEELARQAKLQCLAEEITADDRGDEGPQRRCPRCGQAQRYKGDVARDLVFDCGTLTAQRAYDICPACGQRSYPLDEQLGLGEEQEQGSLPEKLALVAVWTPYPQAPQVCQTLLGSERPASRLRRVALRAAQRLTASAHCQMLPPRERDRIYLQVDGQMCPPREPRQGADDQGYREVKAVLAFSQADVAEVSKERHEILHKILHAKITESETVHETFTTVYQQARGASAAEVLVLAAGARWIWAMAEELVPQAIQILDFSHAKHYLGEAGKQIYGEGSAFVRPWVKEQEPLLLEDKVEQVIAHIAYFLDLAPARASILPYFHQNAVRMRYGTYRQRGYFIGSGAIESAGKQLTTARIKGAGMRWNVTDLNALLTLRCVFLEQSWQTYWRSCAQLAA
jgi:hypothetical protein